MERCGMNTHTHTHNPLMIMVYRKYNGQFPQLKLNDKQFLQKSCLVSHEVPTTMPILPLHRLKKEQKTVSA